MAQTYIIISLLIVVIALLFFLIKLSDTIVLLKAELKGMKEARDLAYLRAEHLHKSLIDEKFDRKLVSDSFQSVRAAIVALCQAYNQIEEPALNLIKKKDLNNYYVKETSQDD